MNRIVVVADAGGMAPGETFHVGDEAMLAACLRLLARLTPSAQLIVTSSAPASTARSHDCEAIRRLAVAETPAEDGWRARRAFAAARRPRDLAANASDIACIEAVADADAVVFAGAGNLCSLYPGLLYERLAVASIARRHSIPLLLSGQTVGPYLAREDFLRLRTALGAASFVGAREAFTLDLLQRMATPTPPLLQLDDAFPLSSKSRDDGEADPWIAVTLHHGSGGLDIDAVAAALDACSGATGWPLVYVPHFVSAVPEWSDAMTAAELERALSSPLEILPIASPAQTAALTGAATMVVSSRYHPLVFALGHGVPCVGVVQDAYHRVKLAGALEHAGLDRFAVGPGQEVLGDALAEAVEQREEIRRRLEARRGEWQALMAEHEQMFAAALCGRRA